MTEILELAKQAGFIKQDMSLAHEAIEKNVYLVPSDSHLREFASLLREKFIAELGEPVLFAVKDYVGCAKHHNGQTLCALKKTELHSIQLYALPKDKDERK